MQTCSPYLYLYGKHIKKRPVSHLRNQIQISESVRVMHGHIWNALSQRHKRNFYNKKNSKCRNILNLNDTENIIRQYYHNLRSASSVMGKVCHWLTLLIHLGADPKFSRWMEIRKQQDWVFQKCLYRWKLYFTVQWGIMSLGVRPWACFKQIKAISGSKWGHVWVKRLQ